MSLGGLIYRQYARLALWWLKAGLLRQPGPEALMSADWPRSLHSPTEFYLDYFRYFHQRLPAELREHRFFFQRGAGWFGEDAMHVMWLALFQEFRPARFLEIGVYRGQILTLAALLARRLEFPCAVHGLSPFSSAGDAVSTYREDVDYLEETLANFKHFALPAPEVFKGFSTDPEAVAWIQAQTWDMIYIDGNHDYETVRRDWDTCSRSIRPEGVIVLDDAGLNTSYRPPLFLATGGHPGPSRLTGEIDRNCFCEILQVGHNRAFQKIA